MEIAPIGYVLMPLGLLLFFVSPSLLYWWTIFSLPFSATAILNVGSNGNFSGLQVWMFFGALWVVHEAVRVRKTTICPYRSQMRTSVKRLMIFLLAALFSLMMPLWISGRLAIWSPTLDDAHPLFFSVQHVTQFLYLAYGAMFTVFVAAKNMDFVQFKRTIKIVVFSSLFVNCWGLFQWFCYQMNITYPAFLFNTNKNETAMGFSTELSELGIPRISSVSTEPSFLTQYLLIVFVFTLFAVLAQEPLISKFWDRLALGLTFLVLLLTTSSMAYLGLSLLIPLCLVGFARVGRLRYRDVVMFLAALGGACLLIYYQTAVVQDLADTVLFSKSDSYSALERITSVVLAAGYFWRYPVLGVGWGSVTSHDLIFKLLANTGIVGLIAFAMFLKSLGFGLWKSAEGGRAATNSSPRSYWASCMFIVSLILIFTNVFGDFAFVYGHLWFVFGMSLAILGQEARGTTYRTMARQVGV